MTSALTRVAEERVLPVVVLHDPAQARPLAEALLAGGISCAEITLRTEAGLAGIRAAAQVDGFTVGAGTVLTPEQASASVAAGARFLVSPGLDEDVLDRAAELGVPAVPGVATATEVHRALRHGVDLLKVFPAEILGGTGLLRALAGPFPQARFVPSGGVDQLNAAEYLALSNVVAISGSWMVPSSAIAAGDFATVQRLAEQAARAAGPR